MFFTQYFPLLSGPVPLTIPRFFWQCVQAQFPLDAQLDCGQPVPASINFLHTALLRQHYAYHFPESLTWSYLQFSPPTSAKDRHHFSLIAAAWLIHLQLLTLNQGLAIVLPSRSSAPFAIPLTSSPVRTARLDVMFRKHHARSVSLNALHFMSTTPTEPESPLRTVSSRTPPSVYAEDFSFSENNYAPAQFTFQSLERFLLALLCICVTYFLFLNLTFALYLYFQ